MTIYWKAVEQYFTVVMFVFQFHPSCHFKKFMNFGLGTVRSERVLKGYPHYCHKKCISSFFILISRMEVVCITCVSGDTILNSNCSENTLSCQR